MTVANGFAVGGSGLLNFGAASLQITTNDQGLTGSGGPQSDSDTVAIAVAASLIEFAQQTYTAPESGGHFFGGFSKCW